MKNFKRFKKHYINYQLQKSLINFLSLIFVSLTFVSFLKTKIFFIIPVLSFIPLLKLLIKKDLFFARELEKLLKNYEGKIVTALMYRNEDDIYKKTYSERIFNKIDQIDLKNLIKKDFGSERKLFILSLSIFTFFLLILPQNFVSVFYNIPEVKEKIFYKKPPEFHYITKNFVYSAKIIGEKISSAEILTKFKKEKGKIKVPVENNKITFIYKPEVGTLYFKIKTKNDETPYLKTVFVEPPKIVKIKAFTNREIGEIPFVKIKENKKVKFEIELSREVDSEKIYIGKEKLKFQNVKSFDFEKAFVNKKTIKFVHFIKNDSFPDPQKIYVNVIKEYKPFVKIIYPLKDTTIPDEMKIPFILYASDDIGLDKAIAYIERNGEIIFEKIVNKFNNKKTDTFSYIVDFDPINPKPGEDFYVFFKVFDNDEIKKYSETRKVKIHMPTFEEIYSKVKKESEFAEREMKPLNKEAKELLKELKSIKENISKLSKKELRTELKEFEKSLEEITKKLEKIEKKISKLEENVISLDPEINEKLHRISELMNELFKEELKEAVKKLEEALRRGNREEIEKRLKELLAKKEIWKENLERTLSLLERIKKEYDLKRLVEKAKEIERETAKISKEPSLSEIKKESKKLENLLEELSELKKDFKEEEVKGELEKAEEEGAKALEDFTNKSMSSCLSRVSKMRKHLENAEKNFLKRKEEFARKLIEKSFWGIMGFIKEIEENKENDFYKDLFLAYTNFCDEISLEARQTLLFPKQVITEMNMAKFFFEQFLDFLFNAEFNQARSSLKELRGSLARASYLLLQFSEELAKTGGSEGEFLKNLMKKLSEMLKKQSSINQMSFSLMPIPSPQMLSEEEKKLIEQLAKEQGELAEELSKLLKEMEQRGENLGGLSKSLEGAQKEMKEAEKKLRNKELTERLKKLQERILSRLLQAQRSIRKREFIKRRYAERPKPYKVKIPEKLNFDEYLKIMQGKRKLFKNKKMLPYQINSILKYYEYLENYENK